MTFWYTVHYLLCISFVEVTVLHYSLVGSQTRVCWCHAFFHSLREHTNSVKPYISSLPGLWRERKGREKGGRREGVGRKEGGGEGEGRKKEGARR